MVAQLSQMLPLGTPLPDFTLRDAVSGEDVRLGDALDEGGLLVAFLSNHCPYVVHIRERFLEVAQDALDEGVGVLAINSNSVITHPQDGPEPMRELATEEAWGFPFLFDPTQVVAKTFRAACTPDFYLFDGDGRLFYRGRFDGAKPGNGEPVTGADLREALSRLAAGEGSQELQQPSIGCSIKWIPGQEPDYFG